MDKAVNTLKLIALSLVNDAGYTVDKTVHTVLYKTEMGVHSVIYLVLLEEVTGERLSLSFDDLIENVKNTQHAKNTFYYYLLVTDDNCLNIHLPVLKSKLKDCSDKGVLCDVIYFDYVKHLFGTISGIKIPDRKLRNGLSHVIGTLSESDPEETIQRKSQEYVEIEKEMKPVAKINFINPATVLIFINILIFAFGNLYKIFNGYDITIIYGIQDNELIAKGEVWRLFTSMFLHADITHIFGNMLSLYFFGLVVLPFYSKKRFVILYFLSGLCGNILSYFFLDAPSLGASGAIMGVGGLLIYSMFFSKKGYLFRRRANFFAFAYMIVFNLVYGLFQEGIDNYGHFGGFVAGFLIAWFFARRNKDNNVA